MTSLAPLHRRLHRVLRRRRWLRWIAGLTPLATAILWILGAAFLLDWLLEMNRAQRVVMWLVGIAGLLWAYRRYGRPWVRGKESEVDVALLIERKAHLDTDVVAALQFESPEAPAWGSVQLEQAVMEHTAQLAPILPLDEGLPKKPIQRRTLVLACTAAAALLLIVAYPTHVQIFLSRLLLSNRHYPTRTMIEWVKINGQVLPPEASTHWVVEGQPVRVEVFGSGELPDEGQLELTLVSTRTRTTVPLPRIQKEHTPPTANEEKQEGDIPAALYQGELARLTDPAWVQIYLGDAWTEPIQLLLVPLPRIELVMEVAPPEYAQDGDVPKGRYPGLCQLAVVEGSQVRIQISSDKRLQEANVRIDDQKYPMQRAESGPGEPVAKDQANPIQWWTLSPVGTPLEAVISPLQFTIEVTDEHHLSLEHPIQGFLRIMPDLAPRVVAAQRTPRILPTAQPRIFYEASDDFGIAKITLLRQVVRSDGSTQEDNVVLYQIGANEKPAKTQQATTQVPLDSLQLVPGDQLRMTVRVEDYRGPRPGQLGLSEPLVFQVTDLAGILAAITEADRQLVQEYQEMIDRQLEIGGEKP